MKYFKDHDGNVFAFAADGSEDEFIGGDLIAISEAEADALRMPILTKDQLCEAIDAAADTARMKVVGDPIRVVEYERAASEATAYQASGYSGQVPQTVQSWAEAKGWTPKQATDDILAEAAAFNAALYGLRDIRLKAKEAVRKADDDFAARPLADAAIAQIHAAIFGF